MSEKHVPSTYILIAGAWHASWCWELVAERLRAEGARVVTPDLAGVGPAPGPTDRPVVLADWVQQVTEIIRAREGPVILVGHSRGGIVLTAVAEHIPEHIRALVYVTAFLLPNGETLMSVASAVAENELGPLIQAAPDGTSTLDPQMIGHVMYNRTRPALINRARSLIGPEPMAATIEPTRTTPERFGTVARVYIECTDDRTIPIELQRRMQSALPCEHVLSIDTDHSPFYSEPDVLTRHLLDVDAIYAIKT